MLYNPNLSTQPPPTMHPTRPRIDPPSADTCPLRMEIEEALDEEFAEEENVYAVAELPSELSP